MPSLTIKTRAGIYILIYIGVILLISLSILAGSYYWSAILGMRRDIDRVAKELVTSRLFIENQEIKFRLDNEGRTLSAYLRDVNMSAEILDNSEKIVAKYGIFQNENEIGDFRIKGNETDYSEFVTKSGEKYLTLTVKILNKGNIEGKLIVASPMLILGHVKEIGVWMVLGVLMFSLLISWPLSHFLVGMVFRSLDKLVLSMESVEINTLSKKIDYDGNDSDEIGILVRTYNRLLDRLNEGVQKQKSFISNASHELKTPLARMVSTLDVNGDKTILRNELMQLSQKVDEMLLLSRYDEGKNKISKEWFSPKEEVEAMTKKEGGKIKIDCNFDNNIQSDKVGFELVVSNLISNAVKYNRVGGEINVRIYSEKSNLYVDVRDEGEGINKSFLGKIFDRFSREDKHLGRVEGFGVGLSLVKQVCEFNGWKIKFDEEHRGGTRVVLLMVNVT